MVLSEHSLVDFFSFSQYIHKQKNVQQSLTSEPGKNKNTVLKGCFFSLDIAIIVHFLGNFDCLKNLFLEF